NGKSGLRVTRVLHIGDMQNGFMREDGNLYVKGAMDLIGPADRFLRKTAGAFDHTFIVMDTHFTEEYVGSSEAEQFPLHCEFGTGDWELSVDTSDLPCRQFIMKNRFDMWSRAGDSTPEFRDPERRAAYENLFHFVDDPLMPTRRMAREEFVQAIGQDGDPARIEVTMIGVAADYCIRFAMEGWLARGARVTVLTDLTRGIGKEAPEVLSEERYRPYLDGRLRAVDSTEFLREE
ncbi:MAG: isochorismatase family protein, partial [Methanoregulaceae archaeon]|nr:isochorismatase family protein [Methanoregulaceae archaeon]